MPHLRALGVAYVAALFVAASGCKIPSYPSLPDAAAPGALPVGAGVGGTCSRDLDCRRGLSCATDSHTCQPVSDKVPGTSCFLTAECLPGNYCSPLGVCAGAGSGVAGGQCSTEGDCGPGLVCNLSGL